MDHAGVIDKIRNLIADLKVTCDRLSELEKDRLAGEEESYRNQLDVLKGQLNELMKHTVILNVEGVWSRVREHRPKPEDHFEYFGEKLSEAFRSFQETLETQFGEKKTGRPGSSAEHLSRERAEALFQDYRNLMDAGFTSEQAFEIIRTRTAASEPSKH